MPDTLHERRATDSALRRARLESISTSDYSGLNTRRKTDLHLKQLKYRRSTSLYEKISQRSYGRAKSQLRKFHIVSRRARRRSSMLFTGRNSCISLPEDEVQARLLRLRSRSQLLSMYRRPNMPSRRRSLSADAALTGLCEANNTEIHCPLMFTASENARIQMWIHDYDNNTSESVRSVDSSAPDPSYIMPDPYDVTNNLPDIHDISYSNIMAAADPCNSIDYMLEYTTASIDMKGRSHPDAPLVRKISELTTPVAHKSKSSPNWNSRHELKNNQKVNVTKLKHFTHSRKSKPRLSAGGERSSPRRKVSKSCSPSPANKSMESSNPSPSFMTTIPAEAMNAAKSNHSRTTVASKRSKRQATKSKAPPCPYSAHCKDEELVPSSESEDKEVSIYEAINCCLPPISDDFAKTLRSPVGSFRGQGKSKSCTACCRGPPNIILTTGSMLGVSRLDPPAITGLKSRSTPNCFCCRSNRDDLEVEISKHNASTSLERPLRNSHLSMPDCVCCRCAAEYYEAKTLHGHQREDKHKRLRSAPGSLRHNILVKGNDNTY